MKGRTLLRFLIPLAGIGLFLCFPDRTGTGVRAGLSLCAGVLVPTLFPVSVLAGCLIRMSVDAHAGQWTERRMQALFGLPGTGALPLLLGMLGGFPLGAQLAAAACETGQLTKEEAARLSGLCNNAGPAFLLGSVGTMLGSPVLGCTLFGIQMLASLITGLLFRRPSVRRAAATQKAAGRPPSLGAILPRCIGESAGAMLRLTGAVCFFQAVLSCLETILPISSLPSLWQAAVSGALELTGGLSLLRSQQGWAALPTAAALIGWGGLCVHLQAAEALNRAGLPMGPYLLHKAVQAGISLLLAALLVCLKNFTGNLRIL